MPTYNSNKFLTLPQQVNKNKKDIEVLQEVEINLNNYIPKTEKGEPGGIATLDENGKVPASQVPTNPNNYLEKSGGTMSGPIDMDGHDIEYASNIETTDLKVEQIENPTNQPIFVLSDIDLDNTKKIINATKGTGLNDGATIANINDHDESPFSHPDIRNSISALQGAWVLRGIVEWPTIKVTPIRLDSRIQQLMNRTPQIGDVLQDLDSHEWYFNGSVWDDFGQLHIGLASPTSDGLMSIAQYNKMNELPDRATIEYMVDKQAERIDDLVPVVADKEDEINKVTQFVDPNNITFPTTLAVFELVDGVHDEINQDIIDVNNNLTNYINDEIQTLESETAKLAVSNVFTQPQQVPNATLSQHAVNKLQVETMFEMFKRGLRGYNLAMPDLTGATDLGNGNYNLPTLLGVNRTYNVYIGTLSYNGTLTGSNVVLNTFSVGTGFYTFNLTYLSGGVSGTVLNIQIYNNGNFVSNTPLSNGNNITLTYNFTGTSGNTFRIVSQPSGFNYDNYQFKLQLVKGSTATPYTIPGQIPAYKIVGEE